MPSMTYFLQDKVKKGLVRAVNSDIQNFPVKALIAGSKAKYPFFHTPNRWSRGPRGRAQAYGQQYWTNNLQFIKGSQGKNCDPSLAQGVVASENHLPKKNNYRKK